MKRFMLNLLSKETIASIKSAKVRFDEVIIRYFGLSGFTASVYYAFISRQFDREHKAVLAGRVQYKHSLEKGGISSVLLRRNIHRLEKGLIMQPRRSIFGEGFITETVSNYHDCYVKNILCEDEFKWASDVLSEYFTIVGDSKITLQARAIYEQVPIKDKGSKKSIPYVHEALPQSTISYEKLYTLYQRRRSVRWYMDKPVEAEKLKKVIEAASLAPSACNRQPYRFYVANDSQKATEIAKCAMGTVGFAENLPCIIAVIGDLSAYPFERDRHIIYIDAALASMQLMLACETLGLSTCPINWPDIEIRERMLEKRLGLQVHERTIMLIAVGYGASDGGIAFSQKKGSNILMQDIHNEH